MGLLKKIKAKPSLQSVYRRRKAAEAKLKGDGDQEQLSSAQFIVTSYPKEYSDTSCPGCTASTTSTDANTDPISPNNKQIDASSPPDCNENSGGWSWLISCWGSSFLGDKQTDDRTYESTSSSSNEDENDDGGSGDSSHSMSRIDTVLNLGKPDDVSDITSAASVDDSLSDSEDGDDEEDMSGSGSR